jgi:hypothetical protein
MKKKTFQCSKKNSNSSNAKIFTIYFDRTKAKQNLPISSARIVYTNVEEPKPQRSRIIFGGARAVTRCGSGSKGDVQHG